jgi:signal transduction histidine kinase
MFTKFLIFLAIFSSVGFGFIFRIVSPYLPDPLVFKNLENIEYEGLNGITIFISILSITLFLASTFLLYNKYKKYQKNILLAMSIYSIMMANINLLFTLSTLWNMVWWTWNVMRLLVYIFLFGLFLLGFMYLFSDLSRKTKELAVAYHQLKSTQERLVASERIAAAGIMAATIIHEIRTPIATVYNLIQLISNMDIQSNYGTFLELKGLLSEEVNRIKRITEIFDLSNTKYIPKKETVNLSEEIKSWIESFKQLYANLIARKRVTIESEIEKDVYANIDKDGIKICLYNLIKNAVESTEEGIIKITLKKKLTTRLNYLLKIRVLEFPKRIWIRYLSPFTHPKVKV